MARSAAALGIAPGEQPAGTRFLASEIINRG
jgi:hypothetical protein